MWCTAGTLRDEKEKKRTRAICVGTKTSFLFRAFDSGQRGRVFPPLIMADLQQLHTAARTLILNLRGGVERLEQAEAVRVVVCRVERCVQPSHQAAHLGVDQWRGSRRRGASPTRGATPTAPARHRVEFRASLAPRTLPLTCPHTHTHTHTQTRRGDTSSLARDLASKLGELQRTAASLDAAWRMAVVRQPASARDLWKR